MGSRNSRPVQSNDGRRIYVFTTIALATFVLGIVVVGYAGHGFVTPPVEIVAEAEPPQPAADEAPVQKAAAELETATAELKAAQHAAEQEYLAARQASAEALTEYEDAQRKFLDFVGSHFGELTADIPAANKYMSALEEHAAKEHELAEQAAAKERERAEKAAAAAAAPVVAPKPPVQKLVANPQWTQLRDQLEQLQQQRKKLLDTLTPSHPAVLSVDFSINDAEQKLQAVPAQIAQNVEPSEEQASVADKTIVAEAPYGGRRAPAGVTTCDRAAARAGFSCWGSTLGN